MCFRLPATGGGDARAARDQVASVAAAARIAAGTRLLFFSFLFICFVCFVFHRSAAGS